MKYLSFQITAFLGAFSLILVGLIIGLAIGYQMSSNRVAGDDKQPATSLVQISDNIIYVADQPYKPYLLINVAYLSGPGFIAIHWVNDDTTPGVIMGWSDYLTKGENRNIGVLMPIYDAPLPFNQLIAMLHGDNGDMIFKAQEDTPLTDNLGNPIWMIFNIDESAPNPTDIQVNF